MSTIFFQKAGFFTCGFAVAVVAVTLASCAHELDVAKDISESGRESDAADAAEVRIEQEQEHAQHDHLHLHAPADRAEPDHVHHLHDGEQAHAAEDSHVFPDGGDHDHAAHHHHEESGGAHDHTAHHANSAEHDLDHHAARQHDHAKPGNSHGHGAAEAVTGARLTLTPLERSVELVLGPVPLPSADHAHVMRVVWGVEAPLPVDVKFVGFDWRIVDARGNELPRDLLHHINVMLPERRELFRPVMQRLLAAGRETGSVRLPWPFGMPVARGEPLVVYAMLHNESSNDYGDVYVRATLHTRADRWIGVQTFMFDVRPPPEPASWDLPPGRSQRSWEASPAVDVRLIGIGGHIHRYGAELILEDVTADRVLHRVQPVLDEGGDVESVPTRIFWPTGIRLRADRVYRITAIYDNPTDHTIPDGAMGTFGGIVRPIGPWPEPDPESPLYIIDTQRHRVGAAPVPPADFGYRVGIEGGRDE